MNEAALKAKETLERCGYTCVLIGGDRVYTTNERGLAPLIAWYDSGIDFKDFSAADKVVGKAAAFLYALLGVSSAYAAVMSEDAIKLLERYGISAYYGVSVKSILNRAQNGVCPMEKAAENASVPLEALKMIREKLEELKKQNDGSPAD